MLPIASGLVRVKAKSSKLWLTMGVMMSAVLLLSFVLNRLISPLGDAVLATLDDQRTFTGVVTDTHCGETHESLTLEQARACVQECVNQHDGHTYALYDGRTLFALRDQRSAGKYAGRRVRVTGSLDSGELEIITIEPSN